VVLATVDATHNVGTAVAEVRVESAALGTEALVGLKLLLGEKERLAVIEDVINLEEANLSSNVKKLVQTVKKGGSAAGLDHKLAVVDEERGLRKKVRTGVRSGDFGQNLAVNELEHLFPLLARNGQKIARIGRRAFLRGGGRRRRDIVLIFARVDEPNLEYL
jgi:hypothetical protein